MPVIAAAAGDTGTYASGATTSDRVFSLSGSAGAGDTVSLTRVGTGVIGTVVTDSGGVWSFDYTSVSLPDGVTRFYAVATHAGAAGAASPVFTLNLEGAPRIAIVRRTPAFAVIPNTIGSGGVPRDVQPRRQRRHHRGLRGDAPRARPRAPSPRFRPAPARPSTSPSAASAARARCASISPPRTASSTAEVCPRNGYTAGEPYTLVAPSLGDGTWIRRESGGFWSDPLNWNGAVVADGAGRSASFASLDLAATNTVHLDGPRTVGTLAFGDTGIGTPASWILDGSGTALTLAGAAPTIAVSALGAGANATVSAVLDGTIGPHQERSRRSRPGRREHAHGHRDRERGRPAASGRGGARSRRQPREPRPQFEDQRDRRLVRHRGCRHRHHGPGRDRRRLRPHRHLPHELRFLRHSARQWRRLSRRDRGRAAQRRRQRRQLHVRLHRGAARARPPRAPSASAPGTPRARCRSKGTDRSWPRAWSPSATRSRPDAEACCASSAMAPSRPPSRPWACSLPQPRARTRTTSPPRRSQAA